MPVPLLIHGTAPNVVRLSTGTIKWKNPEQTYPNLPRALYSTPDPDVERLGEGPQEDRKEQT
jgi:hypothetical protein